MEDHREGVAGYRQHSSAVYREKELLEEDHREGAADCRQRSSAVYIEQRAVGGGSYGWSSRL